MSRADFELAKRLLASMDALLITEWMGTANQTAYLNSLLGIEPLQRPLLPLNRQKPYSSRGELDARSLAELERANHWDILLYEFACRLVASRLAAYQDKRAKQEMQGPGAGEGEAEERLECRRADVDPSWRKDGDKVDKPFPDSYLYSRPYCMDNAFHRVLLRELW